MLRGDRERLYAGTTRVGRGFIRGNRVKKGEVLFLRASPPFFAWVRASRSHLEDAAYLFTTWAALSPTLIMYIPAGSVRMSM